MEYICIMDYVGETTVTMSIRSLRLITRLNHFIEPIIENPDQIYVIRTVDHVRR